MHRHACGYYLAAEKGIDTRTVQAYLEHRIFSIPALYRPLTASI
jgi:site-specific recombinase XerD